MTRSPSTLASRTLGQRLAVYVAGDVDVRLYALLRVCLGICAFIKATGTFSPIPRLVTGHFHAGFPVHRYGPRHYVPGAIGSTWWDAIPVPSYEVYCAFEVGLLWGSLLMMAGLLGRLGGVVVAACGAALLFVDPYGFKHNLFALTVMCALVSLAPHSAAWSVDSVVLGWWRRRRGGGGTLASVPRSSILPLRLIQVQVPIIYFFSTLVKVNPSWMTGHLLWGAAEPTLARMAKGPLASVAAIFGDRWIYAGVSIVTVVAEGALVVLFLRRRWWPAAVFLGFWLHAGIDICLDVGAYSLVMWSAYLAFVHDVPGRTKVTVGRRWQWLVLRALDWLRRFDITIDPTVNTLVVTCDDGDDSDDRDDDDDRDHSRAPKDGPLETILWRTPVTFVLTAPILWWRRRRRRHGQQRVEPIA